MKKFSLDHWQAAFVNLLGSIVGLLSYIWYDVIMWKAVSLFVSLWLACCATGEVAIHVNRHGWTGTKKNRTKQEVNAAYGKAVADDEEKWRRLLEKKQ